MNQTAANRHRLDSLIAPRSIAVVGASERNHYAVLAMRAIDQIGFEGDLHLVNRKGNEAFGRQATTSCGAIGEEVETAYLCLPADAVLPAAEEAIAAGIRNLVIVSSGFAEVGSDGAAREEQLRQLCAPTGTRVLGPNCLGYRNNLAKVALGSIPFADQKVEGSIAVVCVSGSLATQAIAYAVQQGVGVTHTIATGNEMNVNIGDLVDYLVDIPEVRAVALFIESIKQPETFAQAAARAHAARKPIVAIKAGASETTAALATAHTGAAVGDDRVFDAACDRLGVVRVKTIEELINTAAMLAATGPIDPPGVAMVSISGGVCEISSDCAETLGVTFPQFSENTRSQLAGTISELGQMHNPLDLTGAAVAQEELWRSVPEIVSRDPQIGLTLLNWDLPARAEPTMPNTLRIIGETIASSEQPMAFIANLHKPVNEHGIAYMQKHGLRHTLPGTAEGLNAIGKLAWWSQRMLRELQPPKFRDRPGTGAKPADERETLAHLAEHGVPIIAHKLARNGEEAAAHAREVGGPVALKVLSPDIAHKTEAGSVLLGLEGDEAVSQAHDRIIASAAAHAPDAQIEGVLVSPMRTGGLELLVGVARDPVWGPVLAIGLGGIWTELLADTALCLLPAQPDEIIRACKSLRAAKIFEGYRGAPATDMNQLAAVISSIGEAALALGPDLAALEVNPLFVSGETIEALDALAVWSD
ncbi:MAG: acetate--CoA ligase family protein [Novosphingobium sp.]|nr:acetate--CoA ligase family protein [Novosphingobium sp.]